MSIRPMDVTPEITEALALLRLYVTEGPVGEAVRTLDNAGVFAEIDERNDYASATEILAESAKADVERELGALDPAEWGDTTRWDQVVRQICTCGRQGEANASLHAGTCPVWARLHNLVRDSHSGDTVDFSGSVFNGPFVGKVVHRND